MKLEITDIVASFTDAGFPFIAITLAQNSAEPGAKNEVLERLCKFERICGKSVPYVYEGLLLHIIPSEKDIHKVLRMGEKVAFYLTDSIAPIDIEIKNSTRYFHDRDRPRARTYEHLDLPAA